MTSISNKVMSRGQFRVEAADPDDDTSDIACSQMLGVAHLFCGMKNGAGQPGSSSHDSYVYTPTKVHHLGSK